MWCGLDISTPRRQPNRWLYEHSIQSYLTFLDWCDSFQYCSLCKVYIEGECSPNVHNIHTQTLRIGNSNARKSLTSLSYEYTLLNDGNASHVQVSFVIMTSMWEFDYFKTIVSSRNFVTRTNHISKPALKISTNYNSILFILYKSFLKSISTFIRSLHF